MTRSITSNLEFLRSQGIPCARALHIPAGAAVDVDVVQFVRELPEYSAGMLYGQAILISYDDLMLLDNSEGIYIADDVEEGDDSDSTDRIDRGFNVVTIGSTEWAARCHLVATRLARKAPSRPICMVHSESNGRIGLMLRRLPPLVVLLHCIPGKSVEIEAAYLRGQTPPSCSSSEVLPTQMHLGTATGVEVERRVPASLNEWAAPLLWNLGKVYHGPWGFSAYGAFVDNHDDWCKVEWGNSGNTILDAAVRCASALARREPSACKVQLALELIFGPDDGAFAPNVQRGMASTALDVLHSQPMVSDLRTVLITSAAVKPCAGSTETVIAYASSNCISAVTQNEVVEQDQSLHTNGEQGIDSIVAAPLGTVLGRSHLRPHASRILDALGDILALRLDAGTEVRVAHAQLRRAGLSKLGWRQEVIAAAGRLQGSLSPPPTPLPVAVAMPTMMAPPELLNGVLRTPQESASSAALVLAEDGFVVCSGGLRGLA